MQIKKNVVATTGDMPFVVDLADFPHGELASIRKDDKYDIEFYNVPEGTQVVSYDEKTGLPTFRDVKFWSIHKGKPIEIVNLEDGRQIITDNDPRAVYGIATKGGALSYERFTPSEAMDRGVMVPVTESPIASDVDGMFYDFSDGKIKPERSGLCVPLDFSFGQFVGVMAGDGWSDTNLNTYLSDNEGYNIEFVAGFLKSVYPEFRTSAIEHKFGEEAGRYGDTTSFRLNAGTKKLGSRTKELIDGHGDETTSGSANKRLPVWYQLAGRDFILGLVNGLIATDGTVCISHGKSKPQLQISFTSTSLRLIREFKRCCQLVGVKGSISFSKNTSGGNTAWLCSVSTIDAKETGLLSRCCHSRKRTVFLDSSVSTSAACVKNDIVPFPSETARELVRLVPSAEACGADAGVIGEEELARRKRYNSLSVNVRNRASCGTITRNLVRMIYALGNEIADRNEKLHSRGLDMLREIEGRFSNLLENDNGGSRRSWKVHIEDYELDTMSDGWNAARTRDSKTWSADVRRSVNAISIGRKKKFLTWSNVMDIKTLFEKYQAPNTELRDSSSLRGLMELVESDVSWVGIKSVEKTGKVEVGYDLTVPGSDTFMSDDGIILSNTVNIHVPASDKAAKQALEKMLPSKNLFSLTDMKSVRYKPEKEQISGLWALTRGKTKKPTRYFSTKAEAIAAYRNGEIGPNDPVEIKGA